ncbi:DUF4293 domain-containing protein [Lewinella sp. IMCC34183]|uniref:DUF4293 domain-containing protein n=1 Tax=Lewinella sp. IMCC34183 TaxID=2248762 RepID=UPI000E21E749|nr:DUF4293 domain-containing protein [Lewinella sp. IMCC34183]
MIQRIQSVFLALGALCSFGQFGTDAAETPTPVPGSEVFSDAQFNIFDSPILIGGVVAAGLLLLAGIFLFRNRRLQTILARVALIITIAYVTFGGVLYSGAVGTAQASADFGIVLPVLAMIFAVLAARYIQKDEKLVRSADRLR